MWLKHCEYFVGKVCTIFAGPINRNFDERQMVDYFVGIVQSIDEKGIWTTHPITKCRNYFLWTGIIGISEEQMLDPDNPEHAKLIKEHKAKKELPPEPEQESPYVDIDAIQKLIKKP